MTRGVWRRLRRAVAVLVAAAALFLLTFAMPVRLWRTGQQVMPPLEFLDGVPAPAPARVWIDTDAACGHSARTDPDDCLALLLLARAHLDIAGVSSVFGNAPAEVTARTTDALVQHLNRDGVEWPAPRRDAVAALRAALTEGPLLILALGPLTNIAAALEDRPDLWPNVARVVAVMGRRPGHLFHPAEGEGGGSLFGHGPIFRDFNFAMDPGAAAALLGMEIPIVLVPYVAAREIEITAPDLDALAAAGGAPAWVAARARGWLEYWREDIGRNGFYPFDAVAAAYVRDAGLLRCADVTAWVGDDPTMFVPFWNPPALLVAQSRRYVEDPQVIADARYCPAPADNLNATLREWLIATGAPASPAF